MRRKGIQLPAQRGLGLFSQPRLANSTIQLLRGTFEPWYVYLPQQTGTSTGTNSYL